jgi:D-alanyl-D-alanine carboxypeptidase (penicillin-binding protein 5/6)
MKKNKSELYTSITLICLPLLVIFGIFFYSQHKEQSEPEKNTLEISQPRDQVSSISIVSNPFDDIQLIAKSAIVKDINSGEIIYQKNPDVPMPLASINKVMTALVAYTETNPNQKITIDQWSLMTEGEDFFTPGETFSLKDLIGFVLVKSSNDGAAAIASSINRSNNNQGFVQKMNQTANEIGMNNTFFLNETGLDQDLQTAGSFGSSRDIATMMEFILKNYPEILEPTKEISYETRSDSGILHQAINTNDIIPELGNLVASKTGFTDLAGGNLAVIVDPSLNRPVVIVVLGSTFDGRFQDVLKLSNSLQEYFNYKENN